MVYKIKVRVRKGETPVRLELEKSWTTLQVNEFGRAQLALPENSFLSLNGTDPLGGHALS